MATAYNLKDVNVRKTWFLMTGFFFVVIAIGWAFSWIYDAPIILLIAVIFSIGMSFFSYWYSDKIVLRIAGAKKVSRETHRELWNITENLCISTGLPMPRLYIIPDASPNAFATGRNPENAVVAVTSGLLELLDKNELEGVVAHELAHIQNRDILLMTVTVVLVGFIALLSDFFLRMTLFGGMRGGDRDGRAQIIMIIVGLVLAILAPIAAMVIKMAISRKREFVADASAALMTRYPEGLASALEKISSHGVPVKRANHAMAHMYISNPFRNRSKKPGFFDKLFMTHPPAEERIKSLRNVA